MTMVAIGMIANSYAQYMNASYVRSVFSILSSAVFVSGVFVIDDSYLIS